VEAKKTEQPSAMPGDVEIAEREYAASGGPLSTAYNAAKTATDRLDGIAAAIRATNAELTRSAADVAAKMDALQEQLIDTGKLDSAALQHIAKICATHSVCADLLTTLTFVVLPSAQVQSKESEVAILDALGSRYSARATLQQARRDALLGDVVELEGRVVLDENSGKSGEFRRLAAEHQLQAARAREDLSVLKSKLAERQGQALQMHLIGR
jgi:hypothetical protein